MHSQRKRRERIFLDAACAGDAATMKELRTAGVSVVARNNEHGETALMLALLLGKEASVAFLLEASADVNATDATGRTPLMFAQAEPIPALLAAGARINAQGAGRERGSGLDESRIFGGR